MNLPRKTRKGLISWQLNQIFMPRLQMTLIMLLTGFAGFLTSFLLLHVGVSSMWIRYPVAILTAYAVFLLLLRLWLTLQRSHSGIDQDFGIDFPLNGGSGENTVNSGADFYGGGGDAGGAGAGGSWGEGVSSSSTSSFSDSGGGGSLLDGVGFDLDLEEFGLLVLALAALLGGLLASLYVVYIAPVLLAEILVDGILLRSLYRRVGTIERKNWLGNVVRMTLLPAILCVVFFGVAGWALQTLAPEAKSIGEVWNAVIKG